MKIKAAIFALVFLVISCNNKKEENINNDETEVSVDTVQLEEPKVPDNESVKEFSNKRFRKVVVEKLQGDKFRIQGEAQVFEATVNWSVEDGHNVYDEGFTTATIGAPDWGKFDFTFQIKKAEDIQVLNLILYEISAEDGNQSHVLLIPLK
jgi:hypothetical protein